MQKDGGGSRKQVRNVRGAKNDIMDKGGWTRIMKFNFN